MACGGCAERGELLARAGTAAVRGAWQEAGSAARAAAASAKADLGKVAGKVAQAAQAALARRR
jgi:hypothetical protein